MGDNRNVLYLDCGVDPMYTSFKASQRNASERGHVTRHKVCLHKLDWRRRRKVLEKGLGWLPAPHKQGMVMHACDPSTKEVQGIQSI